MRPIFTPPTASSATYFLRSPLEMNCCTDAKKEDFANARLGEMLTAHRSARDRNIF
jgi:hypothetical protein